MKERHRAIRSMIKSMSPERAISFIEGFHLPEREANCIIEKEVNDLSYPQICTKLKMSPEAVKEARQRAYAKIADAIEYRKEKDQAD